MSARTAALLVLSADLARGFVQQSEPVLELSPPIDGEWLVPQGGRSPTQSHHLTAFNQEYAIHLMKLDDSGKLFIEGLHGNAASASWQHRLLSPVAGRVVAASDFMDDAEGTKLVRDSKLAVGNSIV